MGVHQYLEPGQAAAQEFALHLRRNPAAAKTPIEELARSFDLSPDFVREVLKGLQTQQRSMPRVRASSPILRAMVALGRAIRDGFLALTANPIAFIAGTFLATILLFTLVSPGMARTSEKPGSIGLTFTAFGNWTVLALLLIHMLTFYRHARGRLALQGALLGWIVSTPPLMYLMWRIFTAAKEDFAEPGLLMCAIASLGIWGLYALLGAFASVVGGYVRMRRSDRDEQRLTRQQLLERLFEVQANLSLGPRVDIEGDTPLMERWGQTFRRHPWLWSAGLGLGTNLVKVGLVALGILLVKRSENNLPALVASGVLGFILVFVAFIAIGYFAGSPKRGAILCAFAVFCSLPPDFIPIGLDGTKIGGEIVQGRMNLEILLYAIFGNVVQFGLIGAIAGLGALIEDRASKQLRLQRRDPAALVAEMVRIQWRLGPEAQNLCIMVVDAARSAEMKSEADPLDVEYSFREYQALIDRIAKAHRGNVHNTAGDGAVVAFDSCSNAFLAARTVQTEIARFNGKINRLAQPFRLRIGLHRGMLAGDLEKVEFTDVIDIAAHVQGAAPIGGITVTEAVSLELPNEAFAQLKEEVDGCRVYLAMNPTLDS